MKSIVVCGDGAALVTGASPTGRAACQCRQQGLYKCACARFYTDATADWGGDSYREVYYFGHTYYQHLVSTNGHDLPVHVTLGPASERDFTLSLKSLDRCQKTLREPQVKWQVRTVVYLRSDSDPRFYPPLPRDSAEFKRLLALRSGCERSNASKKVTHKLNRRVCRSASLFLLRLTLISVIEHGKAWLSEDHKTWGDEWKVLSDLTRINARASPP